MVAAGAAFFLFRERAHTQAILRWPQARAQVNPESIVFQRVGWLPGRSQGVYVASASYEYEVAGNKYTGSQIVPAGWTLLEAEKDRIRGDLTKYATVLYNPERLSEAYLDLPDRFQRGSISWTTARLSVAVILALLLLAALLADLH